MTSFDFAGTTTLDRKQPHRKQPHREEPRGEEPRREGPRRDLPLREVPRDQTLPRGITVVPLHDELWRVTRTDGEVLGYVELFTEPRGHRYRAKRLIATRKQFRNFGEFWNFDDAVDCLRFG